MAINDNISAFHLATRPDLYEPQRENSFQFIITDIDGIVRAGHLDNDDEDRIANAQELMKFSVLSWSGSPTFSQEEIAVNLGNSTIYFAGKPSFSDGTLVVQDFIGAESKSILQAWQNLSYNLSEDTVSSVNITNYKKRCYLKEMTPEMRDVATYVLEGCWVTSVDFGTYTYDSAGKKQVSATIRYDRAYRDPSADPRVKPLGNPNSSAV